jgi:hypothetical protein
MLDDFLTGAAPLGRCFEIRNLKGGMAPSPTFPNIAQTQFYFVDACMDRNAKLKTFVNPTVPEIFGVELNVVDRRAAPLIYSTVDGAIALGQDKKPSHFAEALTMALQSAAEEQDEVTGQWPVTAATIKNSLDFYYTKHELGTLVTMGSHSGSPVIRYLADSPNIDMSIEVQPDARLGLPRCIFVVDANDVPVAGCNPDGKTKFDVNVKAGFYRVKVDSGSLALNNPYRSQPRLSVKPTLRPWTHNLASLLPP